MLAHPCPRLQGQVSVAASKALAAEALSDRYLDLRALVKLLTKLTQVGVGGGPGWAARCLLVRWQASAGARLAGAHVPHMNATRQPAPGRRTGPTRLPAGAAQRAQREQRRRWMWRR